MGVQNPNTRPVVKVKVKPVQPPKPEVSVTAKKPARVGSKSFPAPKPEVTRPVSPVLQEKINLHTALANRAYHIKKANDAENKAQGHYINIAGLTVHPEASLKPGLQALNIVSTPLHAIAGAANAAVGRGLGGLTPGVLARGAKRGIQQKTTYSDVLQTAGVQNKTVRGIAGFAGDVLLDPTTYVTFGTTELAKEAAQKAGTRVAEKALKQGMTHDVAQGLAKQAAKKAAKDAEGNLIPRAVTVGVGKRRIKIAPLAAKQKAKDGSIVSDLGTDFSPRYVHPGTTPEDHATVKSAQLEERGRNSAGVRQSVERARKLAKSFSPTEHTQVIDALESGKLKGLPDHLVPAAQRIRDDFRHMARTERQAGLLSREVKDYVPHIRRQDIAKDGKTETLVRPGNPAILGTSKARKIDGTLSQLREHMPELFSENLPVIYAKRGAASVQAVNRARTVQAVAGLGRKLTPDAAWDTSKEAIYKVTPTKLVRLEKDDKVQAEEIAKAAHGQVPGQYVILDKHTGDKLLTQGAVDKGKWGPRYDKAQGKLKTALTVPRPAYHVRNLIGDSWNAYLGQSFPHLIQNFWHSGKMERSVYRMHKAGAALDLKPEQIAREAGVTIRGKRVTYDELAKRAQSAGVIDAGFYGRDVVDLVGGPSANKGVLEPMRRLGQYRENLVRLNTWKAALDHGMTDREAAAFVTNLHFDYGDLSSAERKIRRAIPFYTFTARNTPLQARTLVTHPGKYANLEKLREEVAKAAGLPVGQNNDYQKNLKDYEQLGIPVPIPGMKLPVGPGRTSQALAYAGLPVTDLNRLTINPKDQAQLVGQMFTGLKAPAELLFNYSLFFRDKIDSGQKVAAPDFVGKLPDTLKKKLGVVYATDKVTGKKTWRWSPSVDYAAKQLPETTFLLQAFTSGSNQRGQAPIHVGPVNIRPGIPGVRVQPYDPLSKKINDLYTKQDSLKNQARYTDSGSPERLRLNAQLGKLAHEIAQTKKASGYAITGENKKNGHSLSDLLGTKQGRSLSQLLGHQKGRDINTLLGGG